MPPQGLIGWKLLIWVQCYKTFYVRTLRMFVKKVEFFCAGKPFQP